jgi:hypothetical protein
MTVSRITFVIVFGGTVLVAQLAKIKKQQIAENINPLIFILLVLNSLLSSQN